MKGNYRDICPVDQCTGCMACINACAHQAIEIQTSELGFKYPKINTEKCIECGLCLKVCPQNHHRTFSYPLECYAAVMKSQQDLCSCASGGVATALSLQIISEGGVVVGASGKDIKNVHHIIVDNKEDLEYLKGSKYVQSYISPTLMRQIRTILISGKKVLFIGTGCQTAGLKSFLIKDYDNLVTIDLVCHGVPSQQMLNDELKLLPEVDMRSVKFRYKDSRGRIKYAMCYSSKNDSREIRIRWYKDPYLGSFLACANLREGCYKCLYAQPNRQSDITVCDFWGLRNDSKLFNRSSVSAVLINTSKGRQLLNEASPLLDLESRTVEEAVNGNGQLRCPSLLPVTRDNYKRIYVSNGIRNAYYKILYTTMVKKYLLTLPYVKWLYKVYDMLRNYNIRY